MHIFMSTNTEHSEYCIKFYKNIELKQKNKMVNTYAMFFNLYLLLDRNFSKNC